MASSFSCDGCGNAVEAPAKVGHFMPRDYCPACAPKAEHYLEAEESLRLGLVERFAVERDILISKFGADLASLPDTP